MGDRDQQPHRDLLPPDRAARFEPVSNLQDLAALQDAEASEDSVFVLAGRYRVVSTLGQGGMGMVYQAHDTQLDRTVAIKTILPQYLANPQASARFFREARALARLNHPNILTLYDAGQDGDLHFLVMELGGRDLVRLLEHHGGALPLDQALPVALAVARALEYAHSHGVIHRDLKPANILVETPIPRPLSPAEAGERGAMVVKVMDFGLAKIKGDPSFTAPQARLGTPHYMSPEQVLGQEASERSDLYAFGVLLYELVTGVRPFDSGDVQAILHQHLSLDPTPPSVFNDALPQALDVLILRLLEKDPARRPAAATEVLGVLERLARDPHPPVPSPLAGGRGETADAPPSLGLGQLPARSAFVGRGDELALLHAEYGAMAAGAGGRLLLLAGEPGAGKTRLVRELGLHARLRGGLYLEGHYLRDGGAAYGPWIDALRSGLRGLSRDDLAAAAGPYAADLAQILPELAEQLGPFAPGPRLAPEDQRRRLYDGIAGLVLWLAGRAPLVLLLDDLQWAPGLTLLAHLARRVSEGRVLLVGAYREQEFAENAALVRERDDLNRARLFTPLALRPLAEEQTAQMVANAFGPAVAAALGERVHRTTRGNAFFVEEVLRALVESGAVRSTPDGWEAAGPEAVRLPESLKLAVEGRVARLGDAGRDVLVQAAVLGQEFSFGVLRAMTGMDEDLLLHELERAAAARLVRELPGVDERYAFVDDQMQEVLYGGRAGVRRRRLHLRAGQAIEAVAGDNVDPWLEDLARHFVAGNDAEKGADYAYRAGRKLDRLYAWSRSIPLYKTAAELWEQQGGHLEQLAVVYEQLGDASFKSTIEAVLGVQYFERALAIYEQFGDKRKQGAIHSQLGREFSSGPYQKMRNYTKGRQHLHNAREIFEDLPESAALGLTYCGISTSHSRQMHHVEALSWATKALEVGERLGNAAVVAQALALASTNLIASGKIVAGLEALERGWQISVSNGLGFQADNNRSNAIQCHLMLKNPRAAFAWSDRTPSYPTHFSLNEIPSYLAILNAATGNIARSREMATFVQAVATGSALPFRGDRPYMLGESLILIGEWGRARDILDAGLKWGQETEGFRVVAESAAVIGILVLQFADFKQAKGWFEWAMKLYDQDDKIIYRLRLLPYYVELSVRTGELQQAELHLHQAQAILANGEDWCGLAGDVALAEGLVRAAQERWPEADAAFTRAQAIYQQYELKWDEAKLYYEWGCALFAPATPGGRTAMRPYEDREAARARGRALLGRAMEMWDAMGAGPWADKCRQRLAALDATP